jgi:hypothetical protein
MNKNTSLGTYILASTEFLTDVYLRGFKIPSPKKGQIKLQVQTRCFIVQANLKNMILNRYIIILKKGLIIFILWKQPNKLQSVF